MEIAREIIETNETNENLVLSKNNIISSNTSKQKSPQLFAFNKEKKKLEYDEIVNFDVPSFVSRKTLSNINNRDYSCKNVILMKRPEETYDSYVDELESFNNKDTFKIVDFIKTIFTYAVYILAGVGTAVLFFILGQSEQPNTPAISRLSTSLLQTFFVVIICYGIKCMYRDAKMIMNTANFNEEYDEDYEDYE